MVNVAKNLEIAKAKEQVNKGTRSLYSAKIVLPLGNPNFKLVHTNQFMWIAANSKFGLENFEDIAKALNNTDTRFQGYTLNRWYIEATTITNNGKTANIELSLNPFASSLSSYRDAKINANTAFSDLQSNNDTNNNKNNKKVPSVKQTNTGLKGGEGKVIDNLVKKIVGSETNELKKAKLIHGWLQNNVRYAFYKCTKYNTPLKCYNNRSHLNCADTARLTASMMRSAGLKCYVVHRTYNGGHFWTIIEINGKKYASDQTGSGSAWNTVWAASGRTKVSNGGKYSRKNGKNPDC